MSVTSGKKIPEVSQPQDMAHMHDIRRFEFLNRHLQSDANEMLIGQLKMQTRMKRSTIQNVVTYAVCLLKPGQNLIDEVIFKAQMVNRFGLKDPVVLERIYAASCNLSASSIFVKSATSWQRAKLALKASRTTTPLKKRISSTVMTMFNYCFLICIFISDNFDKKIDFVFNVFDLKRKDEIDIRDLTRLVRESIDFVWGSNGDEDKHDMREENIRDVVEMLAVKFDDNKDGYITREEFQKVMTTEPLMLDCLGHVLPNRDEVREFRSLIVDKLPLEVRAYFRHERKRILHQLAVTNDRFQDLFPVKLEPWL